MYATAERIVTAVRVRPVSVQERTAQHQIIVSMGDQVSANAGAVTIVDPSFFLDRDKKGGVPGDQQKKVYERKFVFDFAFYSVEEASPNFSNQMSVYRSIAEPLVAQLFNGMNCSILAYGQTGSGKTYTMMGRDFEVGPRPGLGSSDNLSSAIDDSSTLRCKKEQAAAVYSMYDIGEEEGVIPRLCKQLFIVSQQNKAMQNCKEVQLNASYIEIYNERVYDLLSKNVDAPCRIREQADGGAYVENITKFELQDFSDVSSILERGNKNRAVASTLLNASSSRSHAVFTIYLHQELIEDLDTDGNPMAPADSPPEHRSSVADSSSIIRSSKVCLVDLAGSERASLTGVTGDRLVEANNINKSLSSLGDVIKALSDKAGFVPYRNSTLTYLLKDSLGGNSKTTMLATIAPTDLSYNESMSTLRYIERVKYIMNLVSINESAVDQGIIASLQRQIILLQKKLEIANKKLKNEKELNDVLEQKNSGLQLALESLRSKNSFTNVSNQLSGDASVFESSSLSIDVNDVSNISYSQHAPSERNICSPTTTNSNNNNNIHNQTNSSGGSNSAVISHLNAQVDRLAETVNEKNDIIAKYESILFNSSDSEKNGMTKNLIMSYKNEKEKLAKNYETLLIKFKDTSNIVADYEANETLTNKIKYDLQLKTGDVNKLTNEVKVLNEESSALQNELENYKKNGLAEYEVKLQLLNIHLLKARQGEDAMRIEKNELMDKYTELLVAAQMKNDELLGQINRGGSNYFKEPDDVINTLTKERDRYRQALQIKIEENDEINSEKDSIVAELENKIDVYGEEMQASHKKEIDSYVSQIDSLKENIENLHNLARDTSDKEIKFADELNALKADNENYILQLKGIEGFVVEYKHTIDQLNSSLREVQAENEITVQNKINLIEKTEISNYKEKIKQLENDLLFAQKCVLGLDDTKNDIMVLSNMVEGYKNEIRDLKTANSSYETEIDLLKSNFNSKALAVHESDYNKLLSELTESNTIVAEYEQKITEGVEYVTYLKNLIAEKEAAVGSGSAEIQEFGEKMKQAAEYCAYLKDSLAEKEVQLMENKFEIEKFNEKMQQGADYVHYVKESLQENQTKLEERERELIEYDALLKDKDLTLLETESKVDLLQNELLLSKSFLEQVDIAKKRLEEELNEVRNQNDEVISRLSDMHTREIEQWNEKYEILSQKYEVFFAIHSSSKATGDTSAKELAESKARESAFKDDAITKLEVEKKELEVTIEIMKKEYHKNDYSDSALQSSLISAKLELAQHFDMFEQMKFELLSSERQSCDMKLKVASLKAEADDKDVLIELLRTQITQFKSGNPPQLKYHTIGPPGAPSSV